MAVNDATEVTKAFESEHLTGLISVKHNGAISAGIRKHEEPRKSIRVPSSTMGLCLVLDR